MDGLLHTSGTSRLHEVFFPGDQPKLSLPHAFAGEKCVNRVIKIAAGTGAVGVNHGEVEKWRGLRGVTGEARSWKVLRGWAGECLDKATGTRKKSVKKMI